MTRSHLLPTLAFLLLALDASAQCTYSLSPPLPATMTLSDFPRTGLPRQETITTSQSNCGWTVSSPDWIGFDFPPNGSNYLNVHYGTQTFTLRIVRGVDMDVRAGDVVIRDDPAGNTIGSMHVVQRGQHLDRWPQSADPFLLMRGANGERVARSFRVTNGCTTCYQNFSGSFGYGIYPWNDFAVRLVGIQWGAENGLYFFRDPRDGHNLAWQRTCTGNEPSCWHTMDLPWLPNPDYEIAGYGDFNHDNNLDIVWRNPTTGAVAIWLLGRLALDVNPPLLAIVNLPTLPSNFVLVGSDDFNLDGYDDILWHNTANGNNAIWMINGTTLDSIVNLPVIPNLNYHPVAVGDFNEDGYADIVWRNVADGRTAVWVMNGTTLAGVTDTFTESDSTLWDAVVGPR